ncbi:MAG: ABC transporter ATP-binding protein [Verrucomicrobia bacterium]|nr:ABC transporter ATP-binding protein [Verrucomicrobiota bacterium]MBV8641061.1 ABC transporter ATP-binding protein [Verrucomicrobiota bacterium]
MLRLTNISKRFPNGTLAFEGINLEIAPQTIVSIVGPSGSGKSTLLRVISGLEAPSAGQLSWCTQTVQWSPRKISFIFQEPRLMPWLNVSRNVRLGLGPSPDPEDEGLVIQAIAKVGLERFAGALPRELSGGMAQRVAIARALVARPSLILLDEPFSALDAFNRLKLQNHLLQIWETDRTTLLLVTHDIEEALVFGDRVIVLTGHPGRIGEDFVIPLPRPRCRTATLFQDWKRTILASLDLSLLEGSGQAQGAPVSEVSFPSHPQVIPEAEKV